MLHIEWLLLVNCKSLSCAYCILDLSQHFSHKSSLIGANNTYLSTIKVTPSKPIILFRSKFINLNAATNSLDLAEEGLPDAVLGLCSKLTIAESNVDTGLEGRIECFDTVGCQEEDTLEIFQKSKEDADKGVSGNILGLASL